MIHYEKKPKKAGTKCRLFINPFSQWKAIQFPGLP